MRVYSALIRMTKSGQNTHPGDDLILVLTSIFIPICFLVLCVLLVAYLGNIYWTRRGRINGPQHSKVFGKMKMTTSKRRKILKFFSFPSKPHKKTSSTTLMPRVEHTLECPCCGRLVPSLADEHDPTSISSLASLLQEDLSRILNFLNWCINLTFWFALALICLSFLDGIAQL